VPATVTFVDIAGLVAGASKGEGLGNKFLANIRQCDAILHLVRSFENSDIVHVSDRVHPANDIDVINTELILADLETIDRHLPKLVKEAKAKPALREQISYLETIRKTLEDGTPLSSLKSLNDEYLAELHLLTAKPVIYAFNIDEQTLTDDAKKAELTQLVAPNEAVFICAKLEDEIKGLDDSDAKELLESYGVEETGLNQLIRAAYTTLGLQSYLTAGQKEVRAWTIKQGFTAPQAAGVIHSDFERGFIAAQVVNYNDLIAAGSETAARSTGKIRTEGKEYVMQPDDVVEFRFNV
jgi:GTP-binding protein YchF